MGWYAYLWLREDGTPYYAGKGRARRAFAPHSIHRPADRSRILIFQRASEEEALSTERELISNWGRKDIGTGCLRNLTDGGEQGPTGLVMPVEHKQKISRAMRGKRNSLGSKMSEERRQRLIAYQKANSNSGRFVEGQPCIFRRTGMEPPNKGKAMQHGGSFRNGHTPFCNHLGQPVTGVCGRCGKVRQCE